MKKPDKYQPRGQAKNLLSGFLLAKEHKKSFYWAVAGIILLSLIEYRTTNIIHLSNFKNIVYATYHITSGQPDWKEYQNRLLGPFLVKFISDDFNLDFTMTYLCTTLLFHILKNLLCLYLIFRLTADVLLAARYTVLFAMGFIALQFTQWLYLWDYLDDVVFLIFLYGVFKHKQDRFFSLLFSAAILNKESGLFISAWMILDSFALGVSRARPFLSVKLRDARRLLVGAGLTGAGVAFVHWTRKWLLIREAALSTNLDFAAERPFHLVRNIKYYYKLITNPSLFIFSPLENLLPVVLLIAVMLLRNKLSDLALKQIILVLMIYCSILLYAMIGETRVYIILLPFALFWALYYFDHIQDNSSETKSHGKS